MKTRWIVIIGGGVILALVCRAHLARGCFRRPSAEAHKVG